MKRLSSLVLILLFVFGGIASAEGIGRESLRGLKAVRVVIEEINPDAVKDGLNKNELRTQVELHLRKVGIKVLTKEEAYKTKGMPFLYLKVRTYKHSHISLYAFHLDLTLGQGVVLERNRKISTLASTWRAVDYLGAVESGNLESAIVEETNKLLDEFINDYLAVNPK